jgi:hypothetical protein
MKKPIKLILIAAFTLAILEMCTISCASESNCSTSGRAMLRGVFYTKDNEGVKDTITLDSLTITALGTDSVILNDQKKVPYVLLPLRYTNDTTVFVFHYSSTLTDTIAIRHTNTPSFVSMDCGYEMKQALTDIHYTEHKLDSLSVKSSSTNTDGTTNLELYYAR